MNTTKVFLTLMASVVTPLGLAQGLQFINNPGGGQAVYGPMDGAGTSQDAMRSMMKLVHTHFGSKPELGRFFQDQKGGTVAVFFRVNGVNAEKGPIAGLVIVSVPTPAHRTAALVYDSQERFPKSLRPILQKLSEAWPPRSTAATSNRVTHPQVQLLQSVPFPDGSGTIKLPVGWQITAASGGACTAKGPNGEDLYMNDSANNIDPTTPFGRQRIGFWTSHGGVLPNHYFAASIRQDPGQMFASIMSQRAYKLRKPKPFFNVTSKTIMKFNAIQLVGETNANDGSGPMIFVANLKIMAPDANGSFVIFMNHFTLPEQLADEEFPTMQAVCRSFVVNEQVVFAMDQAIIQQIHAIAGVARSHGSSSPSGRSSGNSSEENSGADPDGEARGFTNYIRDQTVIENNENGGQATMGYDLADVLVRNHPDQLHYVPPSQCKLGQY